MYYTFSLVFHFPTAAIVLCAACVLAQALFRKVQVTDRGFSQGSWSKEGRKADLNGPLPMNFLVEVDLPEDDDELDNLAMPDGASYDKMMIDATRVCAGDFRKQFRCDLHF